MKFFCLAFVSLVPTIAMAADGGHGGGHGAQEIPRVVWFQFLNFFLYVALLAYLLRKPLISFFTARAENFRQALLKAESARQEAEKQKHDIQKRLAKLQDAANENLQKARAEAEDLRKRIIGEAQDLAISLKTEAQRTAEIELQRAKFELREELLNQAVQSAKAILNTQIAETDQKRLQTEFVEKIQVVR